MQKRQKKIKKVKLEEVRVKINRKAKIMIHKIKDKMFIQIFCKTFIHTLTKLNINLKYIQIHKLMTF